MLFGVGPEYSCSLREIYVVKAVPSEFVVSS